MAQLDLKDLASQQRITSGVGDILNSDHVSGIAAEHAKSVGQAVDAVGKAGLGKYNLTIRQLEETGYFKKGYVDRYLAKGNELSTIVKSPSVFTGKDSVTNVNQILGDVNLQTDIYKESLDVSFKQLQTKGLLTGFESPQELSKLISVTNEFGIDKANDYFSGLMTDASELSIVDSIAGGAEYAVNFIDTKATALFTDASSTIGNIADSLGSQASSIMTGISEGVGSITESISNNISAIADSDAIAQIQNSAGEVISNLTSGVSKNLDSIAGGVSSLFAGSKGSPKTINPPDVKQTVSRDKVDDTVKSLVANPKVQLPNYTGVISPSSFQPILTKFLPDNLKICTCSDKTLINPTQAECEAAGGTWHCYDISAPTGKA